MYRLILIIVLLTTSLPVLRAQEQSGFKALNQASYRHYLAGDWDSVIVVGKLALREDIDFYYLRLRMGIAWYEKENYRKAAGHFRRALGFNNGDPVALEYLYYCYLFTGKADQAAQIRKQFHGDLALKLPPQKGKFLSEAVAEYLWFTGSNNDLVSEPEKLFAGLPAGVQYVARTYSNATLGLSHRIAPGIRLDHRYTYLSKNSLQYYSDGLVTLHVDDHHLYQHQYYLSPSYTTASGFMVAPSFHLLGIRYQVPVRTGQGFQGGNQFAMQYQEDRAVLAGLQMNQPAACFDIVLGGWYANLNSLEQWQNRLGVTWYPLGNMNLYAGAYLNTLYEVSDEDSEIRINPELHAGGAIAGKVWIDLNGTWGELRHYHEGNGSMVYNSFGESITNKVVLNLSLLLTDKGSLFYLGGRWTTHDSHFYPFFPTAADQEFAPITYHAYSIYGGITWKF
jgi:hypothetical protein